MQAIVETLFDAFYLVGVVVLEIILITENVRELSSIAFLALWRSSWVWEIPFI